MFFIKIRNNLTTPHPQNKINLTLNTAIRIKYIKFFKKNGK